MQALERHRPHPLAAKLGFTPGPILRACGMRRSGNHAIAHWLQRNSPTGGALFLNNCKPGMGPLKQFRGIEVNGSRVPGEAAKSDLPAIASGAGDGALVLITYEDAAPVPADHARLLSGPFDERLIDHELVIYRSFLNWSASLLKKLQANPGYTASRRSAILLRGIDTYVDLLRLVQAQDDLGVTAICYDDWTSSEPYRAAILNRLGLPLRDNTLGAVQSYGGGSSFQKAAQQPADLQTDLRWQQMATDPEYQALLHIAARDTALTDQLSQVFPQDAAQLSRVAATPPMSPGGLS